MNNKFDELTKSLAQSVTRRAALKQFGLDLPGMLLATVLFVAFAQAGPSAQTSSPISWSEIGAKAGADYKGDGLVVVPTAGGARLRCVFQRLEGNATREGLWLTSTVTNAMHDRFRVTAAEMGRITVSTLDNPLTPSLSPAGGEGRGEGALAQTGTVEVVDRLVRFLRPGVIEEYTVSMDGVRQDFIIEHPPINSQLATLNQRAGELAVRLAVTGARVEPAVSGAQLVLENSGRKIAYSRLRVTDVTGKELSACIEAVPEGARHLCRFDAKETSCGENFLDARGSPKLKRAEARAPALAIVVNDADAVYPIRIDPTFSDASWISMNPTIPGADSEVRAAVVDGSGNLYIGGNFTVVGNAIARCVAKWDGNTWSALGSGVDGDPPFYTTVYALAVSGSNLYAGGEFTTAGGSPAKYIAKWDGSSWSPLGSGMDRNVNALAVSGSNLYAGGGFTTAGGSAANHVARWDGSSWSNLGSGMNYAVSALALSGSDVYAGGYFTMAGGNLVNNVAKWDGSSWSALASGLDLPVHALVASGSDLYVASSNSVVKWDGNNWTTLASEMDGVVFALAVSGTDVYAGGGFTMVGGTPANRIAKWDGSSWSALSSGIGGGSSAAYPGLFALAASGSNLYAGGFFTTAGGSAANYIAKWNGSNWSAVTTAGSGMDSYVTALAVSGTDVYAGGGFTTAGGNPANYVAKWNGSSWSALGSGMDNYVAALAVSGTNLYAGGSFTTAGGGVVNSIAKWDGSSWSALGAGIGSVIPYVTALAVSGNNLYAGGSFTMAGGTPAYRIAKWNGNTWSPLGSGMNDYVYALAVSGTNLYAGGLFTTAGGVNAKYMAKWNGSSWSALGSGMDDYVAALAVSGTNLYAAGQFRTAGGVYVNYVAKWDGSGWSALGSGMGNGGEFFVPSVLALTVSGRDLYAGGLFTTAGGNPANYIAKWDGNSWSALGSGTHGPPTHPNVFALAVLGNDLYAGGEFTVAGGKASGYIARASLLNLPTLSLFRSGLEVVVSWPSADTAGFVLEHSDTLAAPASWVTNSASVADDGTNRAVSLPATNTAQFFRLRGP